MPLIVQACAVDGIGRATDKAVLEQGPDAALAEEVEAWHINALHFFPQHNWVQRQRLDALLAQPIAVTVIESLPDLDRRVAQVQQESRVSEKLAARIRERGRINEWQHDQRA